MEHYGESREARAASDAECVTPQVLWPGFLASPLSPAPTGLVDLCYIPWGCEDKATVSVSNATKIHNSKELYIQPSPQSTP